MMLNPDRLVYGRTRLDVEKNEAPLPSAGSALDHIGFSVADLDAIIKSFQAEGVNIVQPVRDMPGFFRRAFIEDPWGTRIALVQDPRRIGLHHVHLRGRNPTAALQWYVTQFGGTVRKLKGQIDGIDYDDFWLLGERGDATPSRGHTIDHLGFRPTDLNGLIARLRAQDVKVTGEPRVANNPGRPTVHIAAIEGPDGVEIELIQR